MAAIGVAAFMAANAEVPLRFEVKAPSWDEVATCTTDGGVNIRKSPSTTAPKMMYNEDAIEDYETPLIYIADWSTRQATGSWMNVSFWGPDPVIGKTDGWLQVAGIGPQGQPGWVSAKYCRVERPRPVGEYEGFKDIIKNLDGDRKGYAIVAFTDEMNGEVNFYVGRYEGNFLVCPYALSAYYNNSEPGEPRFSMKAGETPVFYFQPPADNPYEDVTAKCITPSVKDAILRHATPLDDGKSIVFYYTGTVAGNIMQ